jgi:hypothetical protein
VNFLFLAQAAVSVDEFGPWGRLGVLGFLMALLAWILTKSGPQHLADFRGDVAALSKGFSDTVERLVEAFQKSLNERDARDAAERNLDRALLRSIGDQFTEALKEERTECRNERIADRESFQQMLKDAIEERNA